ncbi:MAG: hypothetical protein J0H32_08200 [Rhizobiales bacterium]|nr:hypothetical protein [Hyphomicrobiales bacterium]
MQHKGSDMANESKMEPKRRGRRAGDPNAMRSERLVLRVHPDLIAALNLAADEAGLSRSTYGERCLISRLNEDPRNSLDHVGRRVPPETLNKRESPLGSMASFEKRWQNFRRMRRTVILEDIDEPHPDQFVLDEYGRDESGRPVRSEPRPPYREGFGKPVKAPKRRK